MSLHTTGSLQQERRRKSLSPTQHYKCCGARGGATLASPRPDTGRSPTAFKSASTGPVHVLGKLIVFTGHTAVREGLFSAGRERRSVASVAHYSPRADRRQPKLSRDGGRQGQPLEARYTSTPIYLLSNGYFAPIRTRVSLVTRCVVAAMCLREPRVGRLLLFYTERETERPSAQATRRTTPVRATHSHGPHPYGSKTKSL